MAKKPTAVKGIAVRGNTIRIWFFWQGKRCWETLELTPTPPNLKYAARLREDICQRIRLGVFEYTEFFPSKEPPVENVENSSPPASTAPTFGDIASKWLLTVGHLAPSTLESYKKMLKNYPLKRFGEVPIDKIRYSDLASFIGGIQWKSNKTRNNVLTVIRQPFELAFLDGIIDTNPAGKLKNVKHQKEPPDPFTLEEVEMILDKFHEQDLRHFHNYFEFAFFTGLRTSELAALTWDKVDWVSNTVRINKAMVDGIIKDTKSYEVRDVELNSRAIAALKRQKKLTYLKNSTVFIDPKLRRSLVNDKIVWRPWQRALRLAGIRYRKPYNTRHTFATLNLMAGANPMWVSRQMGHKNMKMLLENYSRWIDSADKQREKGKLELLLYQKCANFVPESGRKIATI